MSTLDVSPLQDLIDFVHSVDKPGKAEDATFKTLVSRCEKFIRTVEMDQNQSVGRKRKLRSRFESTKQQYEEARTARDAASAEPTEQTAGQQHTATSTELNQQEELMQAQLLSDEYYKQRELEEVQQICRDTKVLREMSADLQTELQVC